MPAPLVPSRESGCARPAGRATGARRSPSAVLGGQIHETLFFAGPPILVVPQQRLGLDPKNAGVRKWVDEVRALVKPYGHLPLSVGPHGKSGKPSEKHLLSPACLMARLAPPAKGSKRG